MMMIPGEGECIFETDEFGNQFNKCEQTKMTIICPECGHKEIVNNNCSRVVCPKCYTHWVKKASNRLSAKIHGFAMSFSNYDGEPISCHQNLFRPAQIRRSTKRCAHVFLSPPEGVIKETDTLDRCFSIGSKYISENMPGVVAAMIFFHPFRIQADKKDLLKKYVKENLEKDPDHFSAGGYWKLARADVLNIGGIRKYIFFSPHWHILGFGYFPDQKEYTEKLVTQGKTPWFYQNKLYSTENRGVDLTIYDNPDNSYGDHVNRVVAYLLTHVGVELSIEGRAKKTYRQYGLMSPSFMKLSKKTEVFNGIEHTEQIYLRDEKRPLLCPDCLEKTQKETELLIGDENGEIMARSSLVPGMDPDEPMRVWVKLKIPQYELHNIQPRQKKEKPKTTDDYGFDSQIFAPAKPDSITGFAWKKENKLVHVPQPGQVCFVNQSEVL